MLLDLTSVGMGCRHGLDVKAITQAATEVAAVLEGDLPSSIELIDTG